MTGDADAVHVHAPGETAVLAAIHGGHAVDNETDVFGPLLGGVIEFAGIMKDKLAVDDGHRRIPGMIRGRDDVTVRGHVVAPEAALVAHAGVAVREDDERELAITDAGVTDGKVLELLVERSGIGPESHPHRHVQARMRATQEKVRKPVRRQFAGFFGRGIPDFGHERARSLRRLVGTRRIDQHERRYSDGIWAGLVRVGKRLRRPKR
jgi:hypothetical protein